METLKAVVARMLGLRAEDLAPDARMGHTPEWDSLRQALLALEIERQFGVTMSYEDMVSCASLESLTRYLEARGRPAHEG